MLNLGRRWQLLLELFVHVVGPASACRQAGYVLHLHFHLQVRGKVNAITLDKCSRTGLLFDAGALQWAGG